MGPSHSTAKAFLQCGGEARISSGLARVLPKRSSSSAPGSHQQSEGSSHLKFLITETSRLVTILNKSIDSLTLAVTEEGHIDELRCLGLDSRW